MVAASQRVRKAFSLYMSMVQWMRAASQETSKAIWLGKKVFRVAFRMLSSLCCQMALPFVCC